MAVKLVGKEFSELLTYLYKSWLPARSYVVDAVTHRFEVCYISVTFVVISCFRLLLVNLNFLFVKI